MTEPIYSEGKLSKTLFFISYVVSEFLTIAFFIYFVFLMLWGLAYSSFQSSTVLTNTYMFMVIPFLPWFLIRCLARGKWVRSYIKSTSVTIRVALSVLLGIAAALLTGILMVALIFLADILFG